MFYSLGVPFGAPFRKAICEGEIMDRKERNHIGFKLFRLKISELDLRKLNNEQMILKASKEIGEPFEDVLNVFRIVIAESLKSVFNSEYLGSELASNAYDRLSGEQKEEIAYKLMKLYLKREGIRISGNFRREIGGQAALAGVPTDKAIEFVQEIIKDAFFVEQAE